MRPDAGAGLLAAALKELLAAESIDEAAAELSVLGFADVVLGDRTAGDEAPVVGLDSNVAGSNDDAPSGGTDADAGGGGEAPSPAHEPHETGGPENSGGTTPTGGSGSGRPMSRGGGKAGKPSRKTK